VGERRIAFPPIRPSKAANPVPVSCVKVVGERQGVIRFKTLQGQDWAP